ncbi:hypothetical protein DPMN_155755 [Dreissena polymorpha]|uniref:Uncharacterized protein n=1 Tax=Dreissena polymorpha TaxID=45954 RepID=A0A9D4J6X5_DREPO|nr:hypothetical protein DPMN_155755 [Dreissena polymorpha]
MSSACFTSDMGKVCLRIWKFFMRSIARSTWILTRDKRLATSISLCPSCFLPLVNGGIANVPHTQPTPRKFRSLYLPVQGPNTRLS